MELKEYEKLQEKYDLPLWSGINRDFDLVSIEEGGNPLKEIRRKLTDKLDTFIQYFGEILQADGASLTAITEVMGLSEDERKELWSLFKHMMFVRRNGTLLEISTSADKEADLINSIYKEWQEMKPQFTAFIEKTRDCWKAAESMPSKMEYFG